MKLENFSINDIALQILEMEDIKACEEYTATTIENYKSLANTALQEYERLMYNRVSYDEYENGFSCILAYADACQKEGFLKGFGAGIRLIRLIDRL